MRSITVYTNDFAVFSDLLDPILTMELKEDEEVEIEGVTVSDAGEAPEHYLEKMKSRPDVVVMRDEERNLVILQHGHVFDILFLNKELVATK